MISSQNTAYNNYDPRPLPQLNDLLPRASIVRDQYCGIPDKFNNPLDQTDKFRHMGGANMPNKYDEVYPCYVSPALNLNRTIGAPPVLDTIGMTPSMGVARNQPLGIGTDFKQAKLFAKRPMVPPMNVPSRPFKQ